jgi:hypothetical protein
MRGRGGVRLQCGTGLGRFFFLANLCCVPVYFVLTQQHLTLLGLSMGTKRTPTRVKKIQVPSDEYSTNNYAKECGLLELPNGSHVTCEQFLELPDLFDVATYEIYEQQTPEVHQSWCGVVSQSRLAVAWPIHIPSTYDDKLRKDVTCGVLLAGLSLQLNGNVPEVDALVLHSNALPDDVALWEKYGLVTRETRLPHGWKEHGLNEWEAATLIKIHMWGLTEYDRILSTDSDVLFFSDVSRWFLHEFHETCVTMNNPSSPVYGDWIMVRPDEQLHSFMTQAVDRYNFSVAKGWDGVGLFQWPWPRPSGDDFEIFEAETKNRFTIERSRRYGIVPWSFVGAHIDQGLIAYACNMSGFGTFRSLSSRIVERMQLNPRHSSHHLQGDNKIWFFDKLKDNKNATSWVWSEFYLQVMGKYPSLRQDCPALEKAHDRFATCMEHNISVSSCFVP